MWHWHDDMDGWGLVWMGLFMAAIWLPVIALVFWAVWPFERRRRGQGMSDQPPPRSADPREVARIRYAHGELSREQFLQVMDDLDRSERPPSGT